MRCRPVFLLCSLSFLKRIDRTYWIVTEVHAMDGRVDRAEIGRGRRNVARATRASLFACCCLLLVANAWLLPPAQHSHAQELVATTSSAEASSSTDVARQQELQREARAADSTSSSRGLPWEGELQNGVWLSPSRTIRHLPQFRSRANFFGTSELVRMLQRAGQSIASTWQDSRLTVGELSAQRGGWIEGHHSHRNGRDADIAFFMRTRSGRYMPFWRFVSFGRIGPERAVDSHLRFDDERNWALVAQLLRDPEARIQYIFVAKPIRARLLVEGRKRGESDDFLRAAAAVLVEPQHGHRHENHFHVRIYCSRDDRPTCEDNSPYWPWFDGASPEGTYTELPILRWRPRRASLTPLPEDEPTSESSMPTTPLHATEHGAEEAVPQRPAMRSTPASAPPSQPRVSGT